MPELDKLNLLFFSGLEHTTVWLIVAVLGSWRITSIIHSEKIMSPLRKLIGIEETGPDQRLWIYPDNFIGELFYCFWCLSVWIGGICTVVFIFMPILLLPFALSAIAILIERTFDSDE